MPKSQKPILCINGSRKITNLNLDFYLNPDNYGAVCSGGANGVDTIAEQWAKGHNIEFVVFPAQWELYGKNAGFMRNKDMIDFCDILVSFWDGKSHGTKHAIDYALSIDRQVEIHIVEDLD